jgi:hypothetical protein
MSDLKSKQTLLEQIEFHSTKANHYSDKISVLTKFAFTEELNAQLDKLFRSKEYHLSIRRKLKQVQTSQYPESVEVCKKQILQEDTKKLLELHKQELALLHKKHHQAMEAQRQNFSRIVKKNQLYDKLLTAKMTKLVAIAEVGALTSEIFLKALEDVWEQRDKQTQQEEFNYDLTAMKEALASPKELIEKP